MAGNSNRNQRNQSESEIENENDATEIDVEESESRFSVTNLTRFAAVAFFVVLGTFAVIHSMNGKKPHEHSHAESGEPEAADGDSKDPASTEPNGFAAGQTTSQTDKSEIAADQATPTATDDVVAKQLALIPDLGLKAVSSMVTLPTTNLTSSGFGLPPAAKSFDSTPPAAKADLTRSIATPKPTKDAGNAIVSKTLDTPPASLRPSRFDPPKVGEIKNDTNKNSEVTSIGNGTLKATPPPEKTSPSGNPKTGDRFAALPGAPQVGGPDSFNAFSKGGGSETPKVNSFSAPKPPPSVTENAKAFADNASNNMSSRLNQLGAQSKSALDDAQQELSQLAGSPPAANSLGGSFNSGRPTQPLMDVPKTDRSAFGSPAIPTQNDAARRNSMPNALSVNSPPQSEPVALPPLPGNSMSTPFAREKNPTSTFQPPSNTQRTSTDPPPLRTNGAPQTFPTNDPAVVRSKAATIPNDMASPMRPVSNPTRSPSAMSIPTTPARSNRDPATVATLDVPGDRQLDGIQNPAIAIQKMPPREFQVNQVSEFLILVKNVGRTAVDDVRVYDQVPDGTQFEGANPQPTSSSNGQLAWDLGTMEPGAEKRIALNLKPTRPGEVGSVAQVTFAARSSVRVKATLPVLEITHQSRPTVLVGDDVIFDVVVKNKGDGPARNVIIQENIPEQLIFRNEFREIEYAVGTLEPGQQKNVRLALKAKKAGRLKNLMYATADGGLETKHELEMEVLSPTLKVKTSGPTRRFLGRNVSHSIGIANNGTAPATNVDIVAKLPQGVRYVSSNNQGTYVPRTHSVFWSLAKLERGVDTGVELVTTPVNVGNNPIKVEATADLGLRDETEQPLSIEHLVDVFFDIDDVVDPIEVGSETQYRVKIVNQGTETATNVQIQIDFPAGLRPTRVDGPLTNSIAGQQISFQPIASLKPGDKVELLVTGQGQSEGDHRVTLKLQSAERSSTVSKEESTRVYRDR